VQAPTLSLQNQLRPDAVGRGGEQALRRAGVVERVETAKAPNDPLAPRV